MICTKRRLNGEIERIKKIVLDNGYPKNVINAPIAKKITQFSTLKRFGSEKCPLYFSHRQTWKKNSKSPWKAAMAPSAPAWSLRQSACSLWPARMFVLSTTQKSFVIYEYKCHCDSWYVGRTSQRLQDHIKQDVPQWL